MYKLAAILLLAPAALAGLVSPLQERQATCESPRTLCGYTCIGPLDICCPAAPNGQVIACSSTDNCWINPDNSPGCCPLFKTCAGQKAGSGVFPTLPSITVTTASSTATPVAPEPTTISIPPPQQTTTTSSSAVVTISTVKSVTVPCSARPSSTKPGKTSTPYVSSSTAAPTGSGSASPSASPLFNGASSSSISVGGILGAMVLGLFL